MFGLRGCLAADPGHAGGSAIVLGDVFHLSTLGPAIHVHVTLTCTTYLSTAAEHVHAPFHGNNIPSQLGKTLLGKLDCQHSQASVDCKPVGLMEGTLQYFFGLKGSADDLLVPDYHSRMAGISESFLNHLSTFIRKISVPRVPHRYTDLALGLSHLCIVVHLHPFH